MKRILNLVVIFSAAHCLAAGGTVTNTWIRQLGADARVSIKSNWSLGHVPTASEVARFSARYCTAAVWDADAPHEIGGLLLESGYVSIVTIENTAAEGSRFPELKVNGDVCIESGALTHPQCGENPDYWLHIVADGAIKVGKDGRISASAKGYSAGKGPAPGLEPGFGASHGGQGAPKSMSTATRPAITCDSVTLPRQPGSGGTVGPDVAPGLAGFGGGVIWLEAQGNISINGAVTADGDIRDPGEQNLGGAAGGAILLRSNAKIDVWDKARVSATGGHGMHGGGGGGGGGRIALYCRDKSSIIFNRAWNGMCARIYANGGTGETRYADNPTKDRHIRGAAGTVYTQLLSDDIPQGGGTVCVYGWQRPSAASTRLPSDQMPQELRDAELMLLDAGAFVSLGGFLETRAIHFGQNTGLDLSGATLVSGSITSGGSKFDRPGVFRDATENEFSPIMFSGGRVEIRPYFSPIL